MEYWIERTEYRVIELKHLIPNTPVLHILITGHTELW
jgi:hypothetical protein